MYSIFILSVKRSLSEKSLRYFFLIDFVNIGGLISRNLSPDLMID